MWWNVKSYCPRAATEDPTTNDEEKALKILADTCRETDAGRFETGLLWKSTEQLPNNRIYHLKSLQRKLKEDDNLAQLYRNEKQKDLDKGYIRRIANAAAVFNGTCLNDHLLPDLTY